MNLTGEQHIASSFDSRFLVEDTPGLSRTWALLAPALAFSIIVMVDRATESTAVSHLYYLPIVFAAIRFGVAGGVVAAATSVVLFHLANRSPWNWHYGQADMLRISMYLAIAVLAERQTIQLRRLHKLASTDDLTGLDNLRAFEARLELMLLRARARDVARVAGARSRSIESVERRVRPSCRRGGRADGRTRGHSTRTRPAGHCSAPPTRRSTPPSTMAAIASTWICATASRAAGQAGADRGAGPPIDRGDADGHLSGINIPVVSLFFQPGSDVNGAVAQVTAIWQTLIRPL